jgi:uncharacterized linocin/CFP29 family protein
MMDYLARDSAPFDADFWKTIDDAVVSSASRLLIGRRFLTIFGPIGAGALSIQVDHSTEKEELFEDGIVKTAGRKFLEIPQIYDDFWLYWRDIENSEKSGYPIDISVAMSAAETVARREDDLVFFGNKDLGISGLLTAPGIHKIKRGDWNSGENAFQDIIKGVTTLNGKGFYGRYALIISPDLYLELQRIQPGTGVIEMDRVKKIVNDRLYYSTALGTKKALLVCCEPQYMDLVIGQDIATSYLELVDLNHHFRILETALPRVKNAGAIVSFE